MRRKTVAQVTAEYLIENNETHITWDMYGALDEIAERCFNLGISNIYKRHPLDRHILILNRLEGSKLFTKHYYRIVTGGGRSLKSGAFSDRESLCRQFELVEPEDENAKLPK